MYFNRGVDSLRISHNKCILDNDSIKRTIDATTQYSFMDSNVIQPKQTNRLPFPDMNVFRTNGSVVTDAIYSTQS